MSLSSLLRKEFYVTDKNNAPVSMGDDGQINIAEEVIASIASIAASEVEGLADMKTGSIADIVGIFGGRQKGVEVRLDDEGKVHVNLKVTVAYGHPIHEVARHIQQKVTEDVKSMTGLDVDGVDVYVKDLKLTSEPEAEEVVEEEQTEADAA
jgi:uncharacterized alkaline shock family protein YloU